MIPKCLKFLLSPATIYKRLQFFASGYVFPLFGNANNATSCSGNLSYDVVEVPFVENFLL